MGYSKNKTEVIANMDKEAVNRDKWAKKNKFYYDDLKNFFSYNILTGSSILEIGCGNGDLLSSFSPKRGVGVDISPEMVEIAKEKYPNLNFLVMDVENLDLEEKFDYIILSDSLGYFEDIQKVFCQLKKVINENTRIIITYHSFLWSPLLKLAELFGQKMPQKRLNWLNRDDIVNLLQLEDFDIIKAGKRFLLPKKLFGFSEIINRFLAPLPIINNLCLTGYIIARLAPSFNSVDSVFASVIIPARNEAGNIENAIKRMPMFTKNLEIIFVEGNSTDNTYGEIVRVADVYRDRYNIKFIKQDGQGKGDAVRKGFSLAEGDILMILDADLTVPPEDLPKFYNAIVNHKGEFINGSRLVYPLENDSMRMLNIFANKFFSLMFSWLLGQRLKDTLCGTKVISKENYKKLMVNRKYFGDFDPFGDFDLIFGAAKLNLKIVEVPIRYQAREYGETNISRFKHGWLLLKMVFFAMGKIKFI